jgi:hypothetical protein
MEAGRLPFFCGSSLSLTGFLFLFPASAKAQLPDGFQLVLWRFRLACFEVIREHAHKFAVPAHVLSLRA